MLSETNPPRATVPEWSVRVECHGNLPQQFNAQEIWKIFQGRVGAVVRVSESLEGGKKWMKVVFSGEDGLKKALCMSGFSVGDTNIHPILFSQPRAKHLAKTKREPDTRRNIYVLNVPHDLSVQAYHDLFTPHGTPTHTVLLKTQDSCSRRRGFVVMSTHNEAQDVISWLDGICIRGFQLRVTWANIDRSNGFMSGYDRATFAGQKGMSSSEPAIHVSNNSMEPKYTEIGMDTSTVVASNIPVSLFPGHEIDILFKPFGFIKSIQLISPSSSSNHPLSTLASVSPLAQTAIVTYEKAGDAIAAKNTLHGQVYEGFALAVGFVSNLGNEDYTLRGSSPSGPFNPLSSASSTHSASHYGFDEGSFSTSAPVALEQNFRGLPLPADSYDPMQSRYMNDFSPGRSSYGDWTLYVPQTVPYQLDQTVTSPSSYISDPSIHSLPLRHPDGFVHYTHSSAMSW